MTSAIPQKPDDQRIALVEPKDPSKTGGNAPRKRGLPRVALVISFIGLATGVGLYFSSHADNSVELSVLGIYDAQQRAGRLIGQLCTASLSGIALLVGILAIARTIRRPHVYGGLPAAFAAILVASANLGLSVLAKQKLEGLSQGALGAKCALNLKSLALAAQQYALDFSRYPPNLEALFGRYIPSKLEELKCPCASQFNYSYSVSLIPPGWIEQDPRECVTMYEPADNHRGRVNFVLSSGQVLKAEPMGSSIGWFRLMSGLLRTMYLHQRMIAADPEDVSEMHERVFRELGSKVLDTATAHCYNSEVYEFLRDYSSQWGFPQWFRAEVDKRFAEFQAAGPKKAP